MASFVLASTRGQTMKVRPPVLRSSRMDLYNCTHIYWPGKLAGTTSLGAGTQSCLCQHCSICSHGMYSKQHFAQHALNRTAQQ